MTLPNDSWSYAPPQGEPGDVRAMQRYAQLLDVARNRVTTRAFDETFVVPREHYELILEVARQSPSGANAQPWHFIIVTEPETKRQIADYFVAEQRRRATLKMKFPTPDYRGLATANGMIVVASDFRWVRAFPVLKDESSPLNAMYYENAERILLQSVAAATMAAHLAAAALGYNVWWVTAIGQQEAQDAMKPLLEIPAELSVLDIMCFGRAAKPPYKRSKKALAEIANWERFDPAHRMTTEQIEDWIVHRRHRHMYRDASNVD